MMMYSRCDITTYVYDICLSFSTIVSLVALFALSRGCQGEGRSRRSRPLVNLVDNIMSQRSSVCQCHVYNRTQHQGPRVGLRRQTLCDRWCSGGSGFDRFVCW